MRLGRLQRQLLGALSLLACAIVAPPLTHADSYRIDKDHTEVRFSWDHLGMSRQSGRFLDVAGRIEFDPDKPEASTIDVRIGLKSLMTGVPALDDQLLRTTDFFDAERHPAILFRSSSVALTTAKTANVAGELTINGITKPAVLSVVWNFTGEHPLSGVNPVYKGVYASGFSARAQILRSDWGITRTIPLVSDEIRITIEAELIRER
ncbi:MAG: YceI family protein [Pseudomonadota bacterium]